MVSLDNGKQRKCQKNSALNLERGVSFEVHRIRQFQMVGICGTKCCI